MKTAGTDLENMPPNLPSSLQSGKEWLRNDERKAEEYQPIRCSILLCEWSRIASRCGQSAVNGSVERYRSGNAAVRTVRITGRESDAELSGIGGPVCSPAGAGPFS